MSINDLSDNTSELIYEFTGDGSTVFSQFLANCYSTLINSGKSLKPSTSYIDISGTIFRYSSENSFTNFYIDGVSLMAMYIRISDQTAWRTDVRSGNTNMYTMVNDPLVNGNKYKLFV